MVSVDEAFEGVSGWLKPNEMKERLNEAGYNPSSQELPSAAREASEEAEEIEIKHVLTSGGNGSRYFVKRDYESRYQDYKEGMSEEEKECFDELVGRGKSPQGVAAAIKYVTNPDLTQKEVAESFDVMTATLRNNLGAVAEELGYSPERGRQATTKIDLYEILAEECDFSLDREEVPDNHHYNLNKPELQKVVDELRERAEDKE